MRKARRSRRFRVLAAALVLAAAAPAMAQVTGPRPPTSRKADTPPWLMLYLTAAIIVTAVVGANLIPSKRGHQD